ncbi:Geranylgeranyl transferase type-1 subunit beta [Armadillidium nasatum]|uniref:Geranylgeranyl transferase type-1 subunit beta n=1 Tax=Armadillidium nasatum TaxID=96803 RepID=A0A5N5SMT7_9CRUS|nr:Geranylgeranyl transferase type-1 subunit beta [Armadillidium nasatum]
MQVPSNCGKYGGGFRGGSSLSSIPLKEDMKSKDTIIELDCGHIAMTYTALASLVILGDDLSRVDRDGIQNHIRLLQCEDGSFYSSVGGSENDMRFVYCASTICYILQDFSALNIEPAVKYIQKSISFEGGLGQGPFQESHGGPTFCGIASLYLMGKLEALNHLQKEKLVRWLLLRQNTEEGGFNGRPNKPADTCYTYWVGATLKLLNAFQFVDKKLLVNFVLSTQDPITGGLGKYIGVNPDGMHTYLGLSGLSLIENNSLDFELNPVEPSLNISKRAFKHLRDLHEKWKQC